MKIKSVSMLALAPIFTLALLTACGNPCAGKTKTSPSDTELRENPCASNKNPCASNKNPCASNKNPCASEK